jgi:glycosyltransferase involved in cell wall biosynthesis
MTEEIILTVFEKDLPISPEGLTGWPWTNEFKILPPHVPNFDLWPKISIVTPNYNGARSIEKTIRSVLLQGYPNFEYIIIDGGSIDGSVEIIKKYEQWLIYWVSEKDNGQSNAINKGFGHCTGEIVNWLCSDDILLPGALYRIAEYYLNNPGVDVVAGQGRVTYASGKRPDMVGGTTIESVNLIPANNSICQPACFYKRSLLDRVPPLDESYHYAMDFELWAYFRSRNVRWLVVNGVLCQALMTGENKCSIGGVAITEEQIRVYRTYVKELIPLTFWYRYLRLPLARFRLRHPGRLAYLIARPLEILVVLLLGPFYGFARVRNMNYLM